MKYLIDTRFGSLVLRPLSRNSLRLQEKDYEVIIVNKKPYFGSILVAWKTPATLVFKTDLRHRDRRVDISEEAKAKIEKVLTPILTDWIKRHPKELLEAEIEKQQEYTFRVEKEWQEQQAKANAAMTIMRTEQQKLQDLKDLLINQENTWSI